MEAGNAMTVAQVVPAASLRRREELRKKIATHGFTRAMLVLWEIAARQVPDYLLPGPLAVAGSLAWLLGTPAGLVQVGASLFHVALSMLLAFVAGSVIALAPYYVGWLRPAIDSRLTPFVNSFPGIGWTLLAIIWLGLGMSTVIFAVTVILLPFMIINIREGVRTVDSELIEMTRSFGSNGWRDFIHIVLPTLFPFMFSAVRVSFGVSWKVALTAELFGGSRGLGYTMNIARQELETAQIFAVIALIVVIVFLSNRLLFDPLQRKLQVGGRSPV
jgi:NitT/TauT family transport system permease protein/sulfonate transport system permease protein